MIGNINYRLLVPPVVSLSVEDESQLASIARSALGSIVGSLSLTRSAMVGARVPCHEIVKQLCC